MARAPDRAGKSAAMAASKAAPLLLSGALLAGGGAVAWRELRRELPPPCRAVGVYLSDEAVSGQLGFAPAPWSLRLWHGHVGRDFARLTVPLYEVSAPFPEALPWLWIPRKRTEVHAALQLSRRGTWEVLSLLEDESVSVTAVERPQPMRTDDILAAESGKSVRSEE
mmetsp:Transcript_112571/g.242568  ORF Transcript_112571/g.242568 Transcript_112571/m.242568 type:complete len:167 (+) Transcript_112571:2-502(+)